MLELLDIFLFLTSFLGVSIYPNAIPTILIQLVFATLSYILQNYYITVRGIQRHISW